MVILDTNIIIDHLRQSPDKTSKLDRVYQQTPARSLALSVISVQELYVGASTREEEAEKLLLATIGPLKILPYTADVAQLAGKIMRDSKKLMSFADAAIAATAILQSSSLVTLDKDDFLDIPGLEVKNYGR